MKILQRLYLREFFVLLLLLSGGLSLIFSLLDVVDKLDDFLPGRPTAFSLALYALFTLPRYFLYLLPMSVLISSLFTFGQAFRRKEIIAVKAAGGRLRDLFLPFVASGALLSMVAFVTGEIVVPDFSKRAVELRNSLSGKNRNAAFTGGGLWLKTKDGFPVRIDLYNIEKKAATEVVIFVTGDGVLREKLSAERAVWTGDTWKLEGIRRQVIETGKTERLKTMDYPNLESPDIFTKDIKGAADMGIYELYHYMKRLRAAGFSNTKLAVDLNSKISFPLVNVFMVLLGAALSARAGFGGGLFNAGLGLATSLLYWFGFTFSLSMGYAGVLPSFIAAWSMPAVFGTLAVVLFLRIPE